MRAKTNSTNYTLIIMLFVVASIVGLSIYYASCQHCLATAIAGQGYTTSATIVCKTNKADGTCNAKPGMSDEEIDRIASRVIEKLKQMYADATQSNYLQQ